jgi:hypothetical protein
LSSYLEAKETPMISEWNSEQRLYVDRIRAVLQYHTSDESQGQTIEQICKQAGSTLHPQKVQDALNTMMSEGLVRQNMCYKLTLESNLLDLIPSKTRSEKKV